MHTLQDFRVKRGADIGSDHNLLTGKFALKVRKAKMGKQRHPRFDMDNLKDSAEVHQSFKKKKYNVLTNDTQMTIAVKQSSSYGEHQLNSKREVDLPETCKTIEQKR